MRYSRYFIPTLKENPQDAECLSHRLMMRAGLVRKLASGTYSYLPFGYRALRKAENIVREEMDRAGALEVFLPAVHPIDLWRETGRLEILGEDIVRFRDRHGRWNVLGPTHEEVITDLVRHEVHSYRRLPVNFYQIQTKFRDEMRPRSGVIRSREFIMKDAYSFHADEACLDREYERMKEAYRRMFTRCGLDFRVVQADPGAMGGTGSQEFVLFSEAGEDLVVQYGDSDRVVAAEMAARKLKGLKPRSENKGKPKEVHTPAVSSIEAVSEFLKTKPTKLMKTMIYSTGSVAEGQKPELFGVLVRGDHAVSEAKVRKVYPQAVPASPEAIDGCGSAFGFSGPYGLTNLPFLMDEDVLTNDRCVTGANKKDYHVVGASVADLLAEAGGRIQIGDFRQAVEGDEGEIDGKTVPLRLRKAIELGHVFKLNLRYSEPMRAVFLDEDGKEKPIIMGCYGIGVNRMIAAAIEQASNDKGIVWPSLEISPFEILVLSTSMSDAAVTEKSESIYTALKNAKDEVLWDDRDLSPGVKFNDADLVGIPIRITVGPKALKAGEVEVKVLKSGEVKRVPADEAVAFVSNLLKELKKQTTPQ